MPNNIYASVADVLAAQERGLYDGLTAGGAQGGVAGPNIHPSALLALQRQYAGGMPNIAEPQPEATWTQKIGSSLDQMQAGLWGALQYGAEQFGSPSTADYAARQVAANQLEAQESLGGGWFDPWRQLEEGNVLTRGPRFIRDLALSQVPQILPLAGAAAIPGVGPAAAMGLAGGLAGAQMLGQLHNEGTPSDVALAGAAASAIGNTFFGLGPIIGKGLGTAMTAAAASATKAGAESAAKKAGVEFMKTFLKSTGKSAGSEAISEGIDTTIEEAARNIRDGKNWADFSGDQLKEIGKGMFAGAALGGFIGGPGGFKEGKIAGRDAIQWNQDVAGAKLGQQAQAELEAARVSKDQEAAAALQKEFVDAMDAPRIIKEQLSVEQQNVKLAQANTDLAAKRRSAENKWRKEYLDTQTTQALAQEKVKQAVTTTQRNQLNLARDIQRMEESRRARMEPQMSAAERAKQQQLQQASVAAPQVLQKTATILNPQLAQVNQALSQGRVQQAPRQMPSLADINQRWQQAEFERAKQQQMQQQALRLASAARVQQQQQQQPSQAFATLQQARTAVSQARTLPEAIRILEGVNAPHKLMPDTFKLIPPAVRKSFAIRPDNFKNIDSKGAKALDVIIGKLDTEIASQTARAEGTAPSYAPAEAHASTAALLSKMRDSIQNLKDSKEGRQSRPFVNDAEMASIPLAPEGTALPDASVRQAPISAPVTKSNVAAVINKYEQLAREQGNPRLSPAFNRWFGDSKVVDADGKPRVMYHGSGKVFDRFKRMFKTEEKTVNRVGRYFNDLGFFFGSGTALHEAANDWASASPNGSVTPVYLSIKNPFRGSPEEAFDAVYAAGLWTERGTKFSENLWSMPEDARRKLQSKFSEAEAVGIDAALRKALKKLGYDGVMFDVQRFDDSADETTETWAIAFDSNQIKSIFNQGRWDSKSSSISDTIPGVSAADSFEYQQIPLAEGATPDASVRQAPPVPTTETIGEAEVTTTPYEYVSRTEKAILEQEQGLIGSVRNAAAEIAPKYRDMFLDAFTDANYHINKMVKSIHQNGKVTFESNVAKNIEALPNTTAFLLKEAHNTYINPITDAIATFQRDAGVKDAKVAYAMAEEYLELKAMLERNQHFEKKGIKKYSGLSTERILKELERFDSVQMMPISRAVQEMNNFKLRLLEDNAIVSKEEIARWKAAYPDNYVPLPVEWEDTLQAIYPSWANGNQRKSISATGEKFTKRSRGKFVAMATESPLGMAMRQMMDAVALVEKVKVQRSLIQLVKDNPDSQYMQIVREGAEAKKSILQYNSKTGELEMRKLNRDVVIDGKMHETVPDSVVTCVDNDGSVVRINFSDPRIAAAFKGGNIYQAGTVIRTLGNIGSMVKSLLIAKNPLFWGYNPARDLQTAAINSLSIKEDLKNVVDIDATAFTRKLIEAGVVDLTTVPTQMLRSLGVDTGKIRGVREVLHYINRTGDVTLSKLENVDPATLQYMKYVPDFYRWGGSSTFFSGSSHKVLEKSIVSALKDKNPANAGQRALAIVKNLGKWADDVSDSLENKTRYIVFAETIDLLQQNKDPNNPGFYLTKNGKSMSQDEVFARAANIAMNITVNFSKKGSLSPLLDSLFWFAGANIAGNMRVLETVIRKGADGKVDWGNVSSFFILPLVARVGLATLCYSLMGEDEDGVSFYDKIPQNIKDKNFIIPSPLGGNEYIKLPVTYGYHVLWGFAGVAEAAIAKAQGRPGPTPVDAALSAFGGAFDNFSVMGSSSEGFGMLIPSIIRPFYQWANNKSWAGGPIMPKNTNALGTEIPDSERYWSTMNKSVIEFCRWLNEATGGSEAKAGYISISPETLEHFATSYTGGLGRIALTGLARIAEMAEGKSPDMTKFAGATLFYDRVKNENSNLMFTKYRDAIQMAVNETKLAQSDPSLSIERRQELIANNAEAYRLKDRMNLIQKELNKISQTTKELSKREGTEAQLERLEERKYALRKSLIQAAVKAKLDVSIQ